METKPFEGFFLLGGIKLDKLAQAEDALELFWSRYKAVDPNTPDYPRRTLPFYIHGDEGRSQVKRPVLIISFQGLMSWAGCDKVNSSKTLLPNMSNKLLILLLLFRIPNCIGWFTVGRLHGPKEHADNKNALHPLTIRELRQ